MSGLAIFRNSTGNSIYATRTYDDDLTLYTFDECGNVAQRMSSTGSVLSSDLSDAYGRRTSTGGVNLYGYVGNDPCNRWDPLGLSTITIGGSNDGIGFPIFGPITGGLGSGIGISFDSNGTVAVTGYGQVQAGVGVSTEAGVSFGWSPGNLPPPAAGDALGGSAGIFGGVGAQLGPVDVQATYPIFSYPAGSGSPGVSINGPGAGSSIYGLLGAGGSISFSWPTIVNNIKRACSL